MTITTKNPQKYNRSWKICVFRRHYLSSRAAEVDKISKIWPQLIIQTQNVAHVVLFLDQVTTGYPRLMQMYADHFSADPFRSYEFVRLRTKGLNSDKYYSLTLLVIRCWLKDAFCTFFVLIKFFTLMTTDIKYHISASWLDQRTCYPWIFFLYLTIMDSYLPSRHLGLQKATTSNEMCYPIIPRALGHQRRQYSDKLNTG